MELMNFCAEVGKYVSENYELDDGGDLCYNLMEMGVIPKDATVVEAGEIVAQHMEQP